MRFFSQHKSKLISFLLVSWMLFLEIAPIPAYAYSYYTNSNGQVVVRLDPGESSAINEAGLILVQRNGYNVATLSNNPIIYQYTNPNYLDGLRRSGFSDINTPTENVTSPVYITPSNTFGGPIPSNTFNGNPATNLYNTDPYFNSYSTFGGPIPSNTFGTQAPIEIPEAGDTTGSQGIAADTGFETGPATGELAQNSIASLGTCSIGAILGRLLSSLIGQLVSTITNFLTKAVSEASMQVVDCATHALQICSYNPNQANQTARLVQKSVGGSSPSPSGMIGNYIPDVSLDSIMFCIINEIITYITLSTIQWINSGFEGNPVFIQNPGALLQRIAAQEAGNFIYNTANGVSGALVNGANQTLGAVTGNAVGLTGYFGQNVTQGLIGYYNNTGLSGNYYSPQPTLTDQQIYNPYFQGWGVMGQRYNPVNNPWARVSFYEGPAMMNQIQRQQQIASLQYQTQGGYYNFTQCPPGQERMYDGSCNPNALLTTVQGGQIKDELTSRNLTKYIRTATAQSFDSIITALVNQLMRVAINKIFQTSREVNGAVQGGINVAN